MHLGVPANIVHDLVQRPRRAGDQLPEAKAEQQLELASVLIGSGGVGAGGFRIDFNRDCCCTHLSLRRIGRAEARTPFPYCTSSEAFNLVIGCTMHSASPLPPGAANPA